ncbi:MAG: hypothetical protein AAGB51_00535 [Planctomycetota bacterium]
MNQTTPDITKPSRRRPWLSRIRRTLICCGIVTAVIASPACVRMTEDTPSFRHTHSEIRAQRKILKDNPIDQLERPVLLLSGYRAVPTMVERVRTRLCDMTTGNSEEFVPVAYTFKGEIVDMAEHAVRKLEARYPSNDPEETIEVDVVAISMGGLVARLAAEDPALHNREGKRLRIKRLFTLATPHRGATLAEHIRPDKAAADVRPGSSFLEDLNSRVEERDYILVCYGQTRDGWVGATNTAPPGMEPYWTGGTLFWSHFNAPSNPWFLVDIAKRLRGEEPIALEAGPPPRN